MSNDTEVKEISTDSSRDAILDLLNEDTDVGEVLDLDSDKEDEKKTPPKESKEEESEKPIKLADDTEESEEDEPTFNEDELDIITPARRQDILKKYPTLFKDFPHLEKAYYRDQQYNELFSTPEDARAVVEYANDFQKYSNDLAKGNSVSLLKTLKENDPGAYGKVVDNYLVNLKSVDEGAFYHVVSNTIKSTVAAMANTAQQNNDEDLLTAARTLYKFVTGTTNYTPPQSFSKPEDPQQSEESNKLQKERLEFFQQQLDTVQTDLQSRVDGVLKNTIDQNMDPRNSMTPYVKRVAVKEVMANVQKAIDADPQFRRNLDRLWEKAAEDKLSKPAIEKIRSAYLSKAKTLLPELIKKSRNEALRGLGKRVREDTTDNNDNKPTRRETAPSTLRSSNSKDNPSKGKRTIDFLNED
jgi:hypothetical protein